MVYYITKRDKKLYRRSTDSIAKSKPLRFKLINTYPIYKKHGELYGPGNNLGPIPYYYSGL